MDFLRWKLTKRDRGWLSLFRTKFWFIERRKVYYNISAVLQRHSRVFKLHK